MSMYGLKTMLVLSEGRKNLAMFVGIGQLSGMMKIRNVQGVVVGAIGLMSVGLGFMRAGFSEVELLQSIREASKAYMYASKLSERIPMRNMLGKGNRACGKLVDVKLSDPSTASVYSIGINSGDFWKSEFAKHADVEDAKCVGMTINVLTSQDFFSAVTGVKFFEEFTDSLKQGGRYSVDYQFHFPAYDELLKKKRIGFHDSKLILKEKDLKQCMERISVDISVESIWCASGSFELRLRLSVDLAKDEICEIALESLVLGEKRYYFSRPTGERFDLSAWKGDALALKDWANNRYVYIKKDEFFEWEMTERSLMRTVGDSEDEEFVNE